VRIEDYPAQEPPSEISQIFHQRFMEASAGIAGIERRYGDVDASQSMLFFPAERPNGRVLVFFHGGGWTNGYKEEMAFLAPPLNDLGYSFVSASYRLAPQNVFPVNLNDAADAIAEVYRSAAEYGYDADAIIVGGHSAGGHLVSLLAVTTGWQSDRRLPDNVIKGCAPISGTFDLTVGCGLSMRPRFLGDDPMADVLASPIFRLQAVCVPFLLNIGGGDFAHLRTQAQKFRQVYEASGGTIELIETEDANHGTVLLDAADTRKPWLSAFDRWAIERF